MFAVVVTFTIKPGRMSAFLPLMLGNAERSLREETACRRFDVCTDAERPDEVFLYELYTDRAGFDVHLASPHFKTFDAAVREMVADKTVRTYRDVSS